MNERGWRVRPTHFTATGRQQDTPRLIGLSDIYGTAPSGGILSYEGIILHSPTFSESPDQVWNIFPRWILSCPG